MKHTPFSVLLSVYCKESPDCLSEALESIVCQSLKPDEVVLVEDGPLPPELHAVIRQFGERYGLLKSVVNPTNLGLGLALARGVEQCSHEYVARMDTDDISLPDRFEKQVRFLDEHADVSVVGGDIAEFSGTKDHIVGVRSCPADHDDIVAYMKRRCPLNHVAVMFRRSAVLAAGNYRHCLYNEDYFLWIRMHEKGLKFANLNDCLVWVRVGEEMYKRRGGKTYYRSEAAVQRYMREKRIISRPRYLTNLGIRFVVQRVLPNSLRSLLFRKLMRSRQPEKCKA